jgi:hypothetical protein
VTFGLILFQQLQGFVKNRALFLGKVEPEVLAFAGVFFVFDGGFHEAQGEFHGGGAAEAARCARG